MSTRERFGKYLLLKKLTEDPLGETFRAGMLGKDGIERVVLLRIFNGQAIDPQRLWDVAKERVDLPPLLRSPNLGEGVEMGELQGIPYTAYDYISGKNLAILLQQAARKNNFIPAEHALLITERIALGLVVASEVRHGGDRVMHGFLVPHLVMISNEGETRLLGFEVATGTRSFAANPLVRRHFGRYLSPEALNGAPPHKSDDVYSLGVMLFELLTGRPLPPPAADGFASVIDQGVLATEGTPIMPDLAGLLKQSLVARDHRIQDVATWHKTLSKWMFDGQYNPTTFNLAFYMHNLFRDEIERESQEIEVEKTLSLPVVPQQQQPTPPPVAEAEPPAAAAMATQPIPPLVDEASGAVPVVTQEPEKKSKTGLLVAAVAVLIAVAVGGYFWMSSQQPEPEPVAAVQPPPPPPPEPLPEEPEEEVDTGPSEQELALQAQIEELIAQRASAMEQQIRSDYDKQLKDLQSQLEDAQEVAQERERIQREQAAQKAKEEEEARLAEEKAAQEKKEQEEALAAAAAAKEAEAEKSAEQPTEVAQATVQQPEQTPPPPPAPPTRTQVRRGDLVEPGPGVVPPRAIRPSQPRFPEIARRLNKPGATVLVRVLIDENGDVLKAELSGQKQGFGFDAEALQAAKKTTYAPATKDRVPVKMWYTLSIVFQR